MKAWVISIMSFDAAKSADAVNEVVLLLVSARRTGSDIKCYVELLASMFRTNLKEQLASSSYLNKKSTVIAKRSEGYVAYFDQPYLFQAERSEILGIDDKGGVQWIKWKRLPYVRFDIDSSTGNCNEVKEVIPQPRCAPQAAIGSQLSRVFSKHMYVTTSTQIHESEQKT